MPSLAELYPGQKAIIQNFTDDDLSLKLMEMGCLPGEEVTLKNTAPLGDPISFEVSGYLLSMRKSEAATVIVKRSE